MKKKLLVAAVSLGFAMVVPVSSMAGDTIKFGVAGVQSGDLASYGLPTVKTAELVVAQYNAKGGINGKKIELLIEDDVCKPEVATNTATKLVRNEDKIKSPFVQFKFAITANISWHEIWVWKL